MKTVTPLQIREFFGYESTAAFAKDWRAMSDKDKDDIRRGLADGSLNY